MNPNVNFTELSIDQYREQFKADDDRTNAQDHRLVDVRETEEFNEGHLPGAINIPLSLFQFRFNEIPNDQPIVLVCARGGRSAMAADFMAQQGYSDLYNLDGGVMQWMNEGHPLDIPEA